MHGAPDPCLDIERREVRCTECWIHAWEWLIAHGMDTWIDASANGYLD